MDYIETKASIVNIRTVDKKQFGFYVLLLTSLWPLKLGSLKIFSIVQVINDIFRKNSFYFIQQKPYG